ncbi:MAG: permease [Bryobacteraceae bacterium]|nr:permease [Bryobacteraceae bacterium]
MSPFALFDWLARWLVTSVFGLGLDSHLGASIHFFFYDVPKVMTLLIGISFLVGTLQTWLQPESVRRWLGGRRTILGNVLAACVGIVTPFCSCSAVPLFIGFLKGGVPLGVTFSYLISAPMVNEVAVALLWGLFGFKVTATYVAFGVTLAIAAGFIIGMLRLEKWVEQFIWQIPAVDADAEASTPRLTLRERAGEGWRSSREIFGSVWPYIVLGIGVGAGIHGYVPEDLIARFAGPQNAFAVPIAVLVGVPLYANVAGVLPITEALAGKGLPLGTVLSFTMAVTALSLPEMIILRKVLRPQLLAVFIAIMTAGIIGVGYLFNALMT